MVDLWVDPFLVDASALSITSYSLVDLLLLFVP